MSVPEPFKPIAKTMWSGDRKYECGKCGWKTPWVHDGTDLREQIEMHRKESPACFQIPAE
jgi:hypothetical protein